MNPRRRLRIIYIGNAASVHTQRWVNWFAARHTVTLLSFPPITTRPADLHSNVSLLPISFQSRFFMISVFRAWRALRLAITRWKPDIVHAHLLVPNAWLAVASGFSPFVTTAWGSDILQATGWSKLLNRWATRRAALNTGDSKELLDKLRDYGCRQNQLALIQWGVNTDLFCPGPSNGRLAETLGLPAGRPVLLSPRILQPLYSTETIVKAFRQLPARRPEPILVISRYGATPEYEALIKTLVEPIKDCVFFIEPVSYELMPELYRLANILITVPSSDSTAVTLLEGMATGNTIIATDLPSNREWITANQNGYLVPVGDVEHLAAAMLQALNLPAESRLRMARINREIIYLRASQDSQMSNFEKLISNLAAE